VIVGGTALGGGVAGWYCEGGGGEGVGGGAGFYLGLDLKRGDCEGSRVGGGNGWGEGEAWWISISWREWMGRPVLMRERGARVATQLNRKLWHMVRD